MQGEVNVFISPCLIPAHFIYSMCGQESQYQSVYYSRCITVIMPYILWYATHTYYSMCGRQCFKSISEPYPMLPLPKPIHFTPLTIICWCIAFSSHLRAWMHPGVRAFDLFNSDMKTSAHISYSMRGEINIFISPCLIPRTLSVLCAVKTHTNINLYVKYIDCGVYSLVCRA